MRVQLDHCESSCQGEFSHLFWFTNCFKVSDEIIISGMTEEGMEKYITSKKKVSMGLIISCCIWCHGSIPTSMSCSSKHFMVEGKGILAIDIVAIDEALEFTNCIKDGFGIFHGVDWKFCLMITVCMMEIYFHFWDVDRINLTFQLKRSLFQEGCKLSTLI